MNKKKLMIIGACVLVFGAIGSMMSQKPATPPAPKAVEVGVKAGIGDTLSRWEKDYGKLSGNGMLRNSKVNDSSVSVVFTENKAVNINISTKNKYHKNAAINDMLPSDRREVSKEKDTSDPALVKERITYHSDALEKAYPESKGKFTTIDVSDSHTHAYMNTVIDCVPSSN